jgi:hypothetical protein
MTNQVSNGKAVTTKKFFSRETAISIDIQADQSIIWTLLTNASDYSRWNSTVTSLVGNIALGETVKLMSYLDSKRVFKLKVLEYEADQKLVWGDAMGKRIFTLKSIGQGLTNFTMNEKIGGPIFPLFAKMIPSFDESFEKFASDIKKESETISNSK